MRRIATIIIKATGNTVKRIRKGTVYLGIRYTNKHDIIIYVIEDLRMNAMEEVTYCVRCSGKPVDDILSKRNNAFIGLVQSEEAVFSSLVFWYQE